MFDRFWDIKVVFISEVWFLGPHIGRLAKMVEIETVHTFNWLGPMVRARFKSRQGRI